MRKNLLLLFSKALDLGINLIDTAPVYGFGVSEEIVGKAIKSYGKRNQIVVATKTGLSWKDDKVFRDARKETILKEVDASLKRLGIDYIDIYQVHWPDPKTQISETSDAMNLLLKNGKIRAIGVSNYSVHEMQEFQKKSSTFMYFSRPSTYLSVKLKRKSLSFV